MFEFLLEPFFDTYFFGCPDSCIVPNGDTHQFLKILFTPIVALVVGIGAIIGTLAILGRLPDLDSLRSFRLRGKSVTETILDSPEAEVVVHKPREPKTVKQFEKAIRKEKRKEFVKDLKNDLNPEISFDKFLELQDPDHPITEPLKVARTETKEEEPKMSSEKEQEFYNDNKEELEKQAKQVAELMKSENITEDEAIDKIIQEMPTEVEVEIKDDDVVFDEDSDVFKQDIKEKEYPKHLKFFHNQFKKKEKPKYRFNLTKLGSQRRDEYAKQIENILTEWCLPMPKYEGKNQDFQMEEGLIKSELKKLALFISQCELMADRKKTKKMYWEKFRIA